MNSSSLLLLSLLVGIYGANIPQQFIGQSYRVRGILKCGNTAAKGVQVKLVDHDFGPDPDDVLDSGFTDANGFFELAGSTAERTTIDMHLNLYHDCNDGETLIRELILNSRSHLYVHGIDP